LRSYVDGHERYEDLLKAHEPLANNEERMKHRSQPDRDVYTCLRTIHTLCVSLAFPNSLSAIRQESRVWPSNRCNGLLNLTPRGDIKLLAEFSINKIGVFQVPFSLMSTWTQLFCLSRDLNSLTGRSLMLPESAASRPGKSSSFHTCKANCNFSNPRKQ
jgi:hypothetical protein